MPIRQVRLDKIDATQNRLDHAKVMDIAQKGASDGTPPLVAPFKGRYRMIDGHHRYGGAVENGDTTMPVRVVK